MSRRRSTGEEVAVEQAFTGTAITDDEAVGYGLRMHDVVFAEDRHIER
jgi:hypothetical protein